MENIQTLSQNDLKFANKPNKWYKRIYKNEEKLLKINILVYYKIKTYLVVKKSTH